MRIQHIPTGDFASADQVDHSGETLPFVDRVRDESLHARAVLDRVPGLPVWNAICARVIPLIQMDIIFGDIVCTQADLLRGILRDPENLRLGLRRRRGRVYADDLLLRPAGMEPLDQLQPSDHARHRRARDRAHDDRIENNAHLPLLLPDLERPPGEPQPAQRMVRRPSGDVIWPLAPPLALLKQRPQRILMLDPKPRRIQPHIRPHQPRQLDIPDRPIPRILPLDPMLLHQPGLEPRPRRNGRHLPGVVALHAADADEGVASLGARVGEEVLQFAGLVAAVGEAGVEVVAFGVDGDAGAQVGGDAGEGVDGGGPEEEGGSGDGGEFGWEGDICGRHGG